MQYNEIFFLFPQIYDNFSDYQDGYFWSSPTTQLIIIMLLLKTPSFARLLTLTSIRNVQSTAIIANHSIKNTMITAKSSVLGTYAKQEIDRSFGRSLNKYFFSSKSQKVSLYIIKNSCEYLNSIDALVLDDLCIAFGETYILHQHLEQQELASINKKVVVSRLAQVISKQANNKYEAEKVFQHLKQIFQFITASKIGFLRGDLHTRTFFQLYKDINIIIQKSESIHRRQEIYYSPQDFQRLLTLITDSKNFRIPIKGIYKRELQSKVNLFHRQILLQQCSNTQAHDKIDEILESLIKLNKVQEAQVVRKFIIDWLVPLTASLKQQQSRCMERDLNGARKIYGDFLLKIDAEKLATLALTQLIIQTFQSICKYGSIEEFHIQDFEGISQQKYLKQVIKKMEIQIHFEQQQKKFRECQRQYDAFIRSQQKRLHIKKNSPIENNMDMTNPNNDGEEQDRFRYWKSQAFKKKQQDSAFRYIKPALRKDFLNEMHKRINIYKTFKSEVSEKVHTQIGNLLIYLLKQLIKIENKYGYKVPLIITEHKSHKARDGGFYAVVILRINQHFLMSLIPKLQKSQDMFVHMERSVPTIIKPLPWMDMEIGGYYSQATNVMRFSNCPIQQRLMKYADNDRIFKVLDFLSSTPWKINKEVLDIVEEVWKEGGRQSYIPKRYSEMLSRYLAEYKLEKDMKKRRELSKKIQYLRDEHSLRSDFLLKLNIAQTFSRVDSFYYPHNIDFRGRVYPIPPHFNHIGNDLVRGLLLFGQGRKLGPNGLKWLKIHTANLMGKDKAPLQDKIIFVDENIDKIHNFAANPLSDRQWLGYQDCWQAIASVIDLSHALKSPVPQDYVSYLHVHQDGSCNGLQHYAALGRDYEGAHQVNLGPGEKPSDIYTHVSKMVTKMIEEEIQNQEGDSILQNLAKKLSENIKRKTIKQTVMTSVYGVTFIGARQQIYRQLRDQNFLTQQQTYQASLYVAKLTLKAISNLFTGAQEIKTWFRNCANLVSKTGNPVGWITPLGLPIVQPYRKQSKIDIIKTISHKMQVPKEIENIPVNTSKQTSAFPPNFVHSLDSSHMMYTAEVCKQKNIMFAAVHDSYWTHASSVDQMNVILRDQFIRLHSEPLLENFKKSLENRFPEIQFPPVPQRGTFDLEKIKQSIYFFS